MMDTKQAIDFVMRQEDATLSGVVTNRPSDRGGRTRFGLAERWHPELAAAGFFDEMSAKDALALAEETYAAEYAKPLSLDSLHSAAIATALLSFAVLEGATEAVTLFQKAVDAASSASLVLDGLMGPRTVAAANATNPATLRGLFVRFCESYFERVAQAIPSQSANLRGWMNRANALLTIPVGTAETVPEETA